MARVDRIAATFAAWCSPMNTEPDRARADAAQLVFIETGVDLLDRVAEMRARRAPAKHLARVWSCVVVIIVCASLGFTLLVGALLPGVTGTGRVADVVVGAVCVAVVAGASVWGRRTSPAYAEHLRRQQARERYFAITMGQMPPLDRAPTPGTPGQGCDPAL